MLIKNFNYKKNYNNKSTFCEITTDVKHHVDQEIRAKSLIIRAQQSTQVKGPSKGHDKSPIKKKELNLKFKILSLNFKFSF